MLQHILQAFGGPGRTVLGFPPTYSMYGSSPSGTGTEWITAERDADYELSPATAVAAVREHDPDIVFLCAPNNPTGTPLSLETIDGRRRRGTAASSSSTRRTSSSPTRAAERADAARGRDRACSCRAP